MVRSVAVTAAFVALVAPAAADAYPYDPPTWFHHGVALIERRGGTCEPHESTSQNFGQTLTSKGQDCHHLIPRVVAVQFGQNPARGEVCGGDALDAVGEPSPPGTPAREQFLYTCRVFARPGTNARPNRRSWPCRRTKYGGDGDSGRDDAMWTAERTRIWRQQRFRTLADCLSQRLRKRR